MPTKSDSRPKNGATTIRLACSVIAVVLAVVLAIWAGAAAYGKVQGQVETNTEVIGKMADVPADVAVIAERIIAMQGDIAEIKEALKQIALRHINEVEHNILP